MQHKSVENPVSESPRLRLFFLLLVAALLLLSLSVLGITGCSSTQNETIAPLPYAGLTLRIACPSEEAERLVTERSRAWLDHTRAQAVQTVRYDPMQGPGSVEGADGWVIPAWTLPHEVDAGRLRPVPESYLQRDAPYKWANLLQLYRDTLLTWGWDRDLRQRLPYALPLRGEGQVCVYRSDWLKDPAHQETFEKKYKRRLTPPVTWLDVKQQAEYFAGKDGGLTPSLPPLPADDAGLEQRFFSIAAGFVRRAVPEHQSLPLEQLEDALAFQHNPHDGKPRLTEQGFVHTLKLMKDLEPFRARGPKEGPLETFFQGRAVVCLTDAAGIARLQKDRDSKVRDRFGICPIPGGDCWFEGESKQTATNGNRVPYLGADAWLAVVPQSSEQPDATFALLAEMSNLANSTEVVLDRRWGGGAIRTEQLEEHGRWDGFDLDQARTTELKEALRQTLLYRGLKNPALALRLPDAVVEQNGKRTFPYRDAVVRTVRAAVFEGKDAKEALDTAAATWEELRKKRGAEQHLADVRLSLGLLPRR
jgi:ABC-type glycerol-3-phosphate transport system substrate-binding protein